MHRYFFDTFDGKTVEQDMFGDDFVDLEEAVDQAAGLLADIATEGLPDRRRQDFAVAVRDDAGREVYCAALIFRDQYPGSAPPSGRQDIWPVLSAPNPVDLIRRSREMKAASAESRNEARKVEAHVLRATAILARTFREIAENLRSMRATRAASG